MERILRRGGEMKRQKLRRFAGKNVRAIGRREGDATRKGGFERKEAHTGIKPCCMCAFDYHCRVGLANVINWRPRKRISRAVVFWHETDE